MPEVILPESYLLRQIALKKAGLFTFVTWSDVAESRVELEAFKTHLSSIPVENLVALISMISQGNQRACRFGGSDCPDARQSLCAAFLGSLG